MARDDRRPVQVAGLFDLLPHGAAALLAISTLVLAAQPIYANDTWIHLALGRAFAAAGPWLESDPYLFAAPGPPPPASWLGSLSIYGIAKVLGLQGLRMTHGLFVAVTLALAWVFGRRVSGSARVASEGLVFLIVLATYRFVQLRPDVFTIAAVLAVCLLLVVPRAGPSTRAIVGAGALGAVWANVHAGFLLGPILVLGVAASLFAYSRLPGAQPDAADARRRKRIAVAGLVLLVGTFFNPEGPTAHLAYFVSGSDTLALAAVVDEWSPTHLLAWPSAHLPPTPAAWLAAWLGVLALIAGGLVLVSDLRRGAASRRRVDPALFALGVAGLVAALVASRFLFLLLFALLPGLALLDHLVRDRGAALRGLASLCLLAFGVLHFTAGDWPPVSRTLRSVEGDYGQPYYTSKFYGHAMGFLASTQVEGRIYNDYPLGGFMSYWLAPRLSMASSGTMNVAREAMEAHLAIGARMPARPGETYAQSLDRLGFDLFLGVGLPTPGRPGHPVPSTMRHVENLPDWIPVFRSLRSAVYLRRGPRNEENLARIEDYYRREGVPFDRERGFDAGPVLEASLPWAIRNGLVPTDYEALVAGSVGRRPAEGDDAADRMRLALVYACLGLYDRAAEIDRALLLRDLTDTNAARRAIWGALQLRRLDRALELARASEADQWIASIEIARAAPETDRETWIAQLPLMQIHEARFVRSWVEPAAPLAAPAAR